MDTKKRKCFVLTIFSILVLLSNFILNAQADWSNYPGPVPNPPEVGPPECVSGCDEIDNNSSENETENEIINNNGNNNAVNKPTPTTALEAAQMGYSLAVSGLRGEAIISPRVAVDFKEPSEKLAALLIETCVKGLLMGVLIRRYQVVVPASILMSEYERIELLYDIEAMSISNATATLERDFKKLRGFDWPTEAEKEQALAIIRSDERTVTRWNIQARYEAYKGNNWRLTGNVNGNFVYNFYPGPAYEQLTTISSLGWLR